MNKNKSNVLISIILCFLSLIMIGCQEEDSSTTFNVRFSNTAGSGSHYINLCTDNTPTGRGNTTVIDPNPLVADGATTSYYEVTAGDYYMCDSPDLIDWHGSNSLYTYIAGNNYIVTKTVSGADIELE